MSRTPLRMPHSALERPERTLGRTGVLERTVHRLVGYVVRPLNKSPRQFRKLLPALNAEATRLEAFDDAAFNREIEGVRARFLADPPDPGVLVAAFAVVREAARRTLGMKPFDCQMLGGLAIFHGAIAEMRTGEGKTLTATLPAAAAALAGVPIHVLTVNDYLAGRDADLMAPLYNRLGLSVGSVVAGRTLEERRDAYAKDIVYCTNKDVVFDYLRDSLLIAEAPHPLRRHAGRLMGRAPIDKKLMLRGLHMAIIDEADSILMDEARTPLVLSGAIPVHAQEEETYRQALDLARKLEEGVHYKLDKTARKLTLTNAGEWRIMALSEGLGPAWKGPLRRLELGRQALSALMLFDRDRHYLVRDDAVLIIDENTGRVMPDRSWEQGLHQLIEMKEGVTLTRPNETLARLSFQRFFRLYHHLGGMTGTGMEVAGELWSTYGMPVSCIPPNQPPRLRLLGTHVMTTTADKWNRVSERVAELHAEGRPVLVGTRTVGDSEALSIVLTAHGLSHQVLNARQDKNEADIVALAGQRGEVTIATNMAGRGTDIKLGPGVEELGGLHVILTELHESERLDRQLIGRCARQGDPGSWEAIVSLQDQLVVNGMPRVARWLMKMPEGRRRSRLAVAAMKYLQWRIGRQSAAQRYDLLRQDEQEVQMLAFAGKRT